MNWKFWQIGQAKAERTNQTHVEIFDPAWPAKRQAMLERLANTPETDPTMVGILGLLDQEILIQVQKCETPSLSDAQAHSLCGRMGLLVGLRADLENTWHGARAKKANEGKG
jgi:hypothetical protein